MVEHSQADIKSANERALRSLSRAISLSRGQFSVVLVCCNYRVLQTQILQKLEASASSSVKQLVIPQNARSLYSTIHIQLRTNEQQPSALNILGLESVEHIDDLLSSINQIRDEFPKRHPFPMIFWVNDQILQKSLAVSTRFCELGGDTNSV
ncbi:hypothetical protein [Nostoc piscinale]|uniref:hypothetical protein n=1 Tax=Nostoc piscinale TaxID=224012 RepID=UPI003AAD3521